MNRRNLLSTAVAVDAATGVGRIAIAAQTAKKAGDMRDVVAKRKQVELFFRSFYQAKDNLAAEELAAHWAETGVLLQDHSLRVN